MVYVDRDVVIPIELIVFAGFLCHGDRRDGDRARGPWPAATARLAAQKLHDVVGQFFAGVLLQKMSGAADQRMIDTLRATHLVLEDRWPSAR